MSRSAACGVNDPPVKQTHEPDSSSNFRKELRRELADLYAMVPGSRKTKAEAEVLYLERYIAQVKDLRTHREAEALRASSVPVVARGLRATSHGRKCQSAIQQLRNRHAARARRGRQFQHQ